MRGTAARLCPSVGIVSTQPVVMGGAIHISPARDLQGRMAKVLGPLYLLYIILLSRFGFRDLLDQKLDDIKSIADETKHLSDHAVYWHRQTHALMARVAQARAQGKPYTIPDWFIWLTRYDVSIAPSRLRAIMAYWSVSGRVAVMGLVMHSAAVLCDEVCASPQDEGITPILWGLSPRVYPFTGGHDPTVTHGANPKHRVCRLHCTRSE